MLEKEEEQSIEEYWGLFRDTLPGAESTVEAIYRILEILNRQVDAFSYCDDRKDRYPQLTTSRNRNPAGWRITLTYWEHSCEEAVTIISTDQVYSSAVVDLFNRVSVALKREAASRLEWVTRAEEDLAILKKNLHLSEKFCSSLGTYTPEQQNLPFIGDAQEA